MFNSDVTQTYNHQDATIEILIMLAGAFLLGCLLCWLFRKLFEKNDQTHSALAVPPKNNGITSKNTNVQHAMPQTVAKNAANNTSPPLKSSSNYTKPKNDDFTKISGIDMQVESELKDRGIKSYIDLRDSSKQSIIDTLGSSNGKLVSAKEARTWPHQASLAAIGDWDKLKEYQDFMERSDKTAKKVKAQQLKELNDEQQVKDDLKKIEGIGPKIEEILNNYGINSFDDLQKTNRDELKHHLDNAGSRFKMHEPESWPHQAGMAERGEWEELAIYQEFMDGGREIPSATSKSKPPKQSLVEEINDTSNKATSDDLQKVEGIGPKIEEVLNNNGIFTFKQLHHTDRDDIKEYLNNAGNQFKMHEPNSWPHQAGMADRREWKALKTYQDFMDGGREIPSASASSKIDIPLQPIIDDVEADYIKEISDDNLTPTKSVSDISHIDNTQEIQNDDLKKIEGIGPKIQELLNKADINTFEDLKSSNRDFIKKLLDEAGPQYRMHEPETWPLQARMAYKGEWKKLEEYQDVLTGRSR